MTRLRLLVCVLWAWLSLTAAAWVDAADPTWRALPDLPRSDGAITGMGVDSGGTLWVMTNTAPEDLSWPTRELFWWDGTKWQEPKNADEVEGDFFYCLYGGGKRGLYAVYWSKERAAVRDDPAKLCKLVEGEVKLVMEYTHASWLDPRVTYEGAFPSAGLHVARDGRLFTYGEGFLEIYLEGRWKLLARPKQPTSVSFVEQGDLIHIVYDKFLCTVSPDGMAVTRELDGLTDDGLGCAENAVLWGDDALLVVSPARPQPVNLHAYEIETGKPIDIEDVKTALEGKVVIDAMSAPDGSVWLCAVDAIFRTFLVVSVDNAGSLRVLSTDGDVFELDELSAVNWWIKRTRWYPSSTLTASDGTFWLAPTEGGLLACKDGAFTRYGIDDLSAERINFLAEGKDGTIYAAATSKVHALTPTDDVEGK